MLDPTEGFPKGHLAIETKIGNAHQWRAFDASPTMDIHRHVMAERAMDDLRGSDQLCRWDRLRIVTVRHGNKAMSKLFVNAGGKMTLFRISKCYHHLNIVVK